MPKVWLVRAGGSGVSWLQDFMIGGFVGVGYNLRRDLTNFAPHEEIEEAFREANPEKSHPSSITKIVNQIEAFLFDIDSGDYILTPKRNRRAIMQGIADDSPAYFQASAVGGLPHRRSVTWVNDEIEFTDAELAAHGIYGFRGTVKLLSEDGEAFWKR